jgi:Predicted membrane protein
MLWHTVLVPSTKFPTALILLITVTPLLLPLRGLLNKRLKSCAWYAYISLIYFIHGSAATYNDSVDRLYPALETVLSLLLFMGATLYVRYSKVKP